jgi:hypothetical protein
MTDIQTELKIPDLWYDFYTRLLPGSVFVAAIYIHWPCTPSWPTPLQTMILVAVGYVSALVTSPISSELSWGIHWLVAGRKRNYVEIITKKLNPHEARILGKMHGEVTFFTQCSMLTLLLWGAQFVFVPRYKLEQEPCLTFVAVIVFLVLAILTASRRKRRADRDLELTKWS